MKPRMWRMKNGQEIAISDMTDSHLQNTISLIERTYKADCLRKAKDADDYAAIAPSGASDAAQSVSDYLMEEAETQEDIERNVPILKWLVKERDRRTSNERT